MNSGASSTVHGFPLMNSGACSTVHGFFPWTVELAPLFRPDRSGSTLKMH